MRWELTWLCRIERETCTCDHAKTEHAPVGARSILDWSGVLTASPSGKAGAAPRRERCGVVLRRALA